MDYLRKQARRKRFEAAEPEWESAPAVPETLNAGEQIDLREQTEAAMMKLSETERSALLLRHFEGHSIKEIAQILDISSGACKQTVFRAVRKMRIALRPLVTT